jgi:hypothetical protein
VLTTNGRANEPWGDAVGRARCDDDGGCLALQKLATPRMSEASQVVHDGGVRAKSSLKEQSFL